MRARDYPFQSVVVRCTLCQREGRYPKDRFLQRVGEHTSLPDALRIIAQDCPRAGKSLDTIHDVCKAHYPDLASRGRGD